MQQLQTLPGVESAGIGETVPMGGAGESTGLRIPDRAGARRAHAAVRKLHDRVASDISPAVGTPMLQGRDFLDTDSADALPVAIVNAAMARKYWPGQDAIGKQVGLPIRRST